MSKLQILLADDHAMMRAGLKTLVNAQPDMEVVGEADNGSAAVALAQELKPAVIVLDISMPEMNGLKAAKQLQKLCPEVKILTLTRHTEYSYLQQLLQAGVSGYLLKKSGPSDLVHAIRAVVTGKTYFDPEVTESLIEGTIGRNRSQSGTAPVKDLNKREQEVLRYTAWGYANKEIAERLQISVKTVEVHKANGMQKMGLKFRVDIVRYALLQDWLQDT